MDSPTPRRRAGATPSSSTLSAQHDDDSVNEAKARKPRLKSSNSSILVDILRGVVGILLLAAALSWFVTGESIIWNWRQAPTVFGAVQQWFVRATAYKVSMQSLTQH